MLLLAAGGCAPAPPPLDGGTALADGGALVDGGLDTGYPLPRSDLVLPVGSDDTLDLLTWNVENFPAQSSTPSLVADILASLQVDVVAVQEIASTSAFDELAQRLPDHAGMLSSHTYSDGTYQKVGFLYRESLLRPTDVRLLFPGSGYEFPRPPMQVSFVWDDGVHPPRDLVVIALHLKAGQTQDDKQRRAGAMVLLEEWVRTLVEGPAPDDVVILGDFNEVLDSDEGRAVLGPFLVRPDAYRFQTSPLSSTNAASFLPGRRLIDHVVTTAALADEVGTRSAVIPALEGQVAGYQSLVSDHLPVALSLSPGDP